MCCRCALCLLHRRLERTRWCIVFEYPLQTSLLPFSPWKCWSIGWQTYWILLTNKAQNDLLVIKQCGCSMLLNVVALYKFVDAYRLIHVNYHSFMSRLLSLKTHLNVLCNLMCSHFCFSSHVTWRQRKKSWVGDYRYFLPTTPPVPFKIIWLLKAVL